MGDAAPVLLVGRLAAPMPSQTFRATATTSGTIASAWQALQRPETWEGIAGVETVHGAVHDADGNLTRFAFAASVGGVRYPGTSDVTISDEPDHIRLELTTSEVIATIDVHLRTVADTTTLTVDLAVRSRSLLAGMFFPAIADSIGRGLPATTEDFASRLG